MSFTLLSLTTTQIVIFKRTNCFMVNAKKLTPRSNLVNYLIALPSIKLQ